MAEQTQATAERRRIRLWLSPVWLIPLIAILVGAWLFYQNILHRGALVVLELQSADGLHAGRTEVKVRSVVVGRVEDLRLTEDYSGAIAEVRMEPGTAGLLVKDSLFWVVKPRIGLRGVSGLGTLWSGAYLQLRPGTSDQPASHFRVLEHPPVVPAGAHGLSIALFSTESTSLNIGDPVVYQGRQVGQIAAAEFVPGRMQMRYRAFVRAPFDQLITTNTQFWNRSGVSFHIGSDGVQLEIASLQAMLVGGITFGLPKDLPPGQGVSDDAEFRLYPSHEAARQERFQNGIRYVVLFRDSVRGLNAGAPVMFRGIRVGSVVEVPYFRKSFHLGGFKKLRIPVLIAFEPQRLGPPWSELTSDQWRKRLHGMFEQGLRAAVRPANLLTGAKLIGLRFTREEKLDYQAQVGGLAVFPSERSGFDSIQRKLTRLLDSLNDLQLDSAVTQLTSSLAASRQAFTQMQDTLATLNSLLASKELQRLPGQLTATLRALRSALTAMQGGGSTVGNLNQALNQLNSLLEELAPLARTLRQAPDALLLGREPVDDPVPQAR